MITDCFSLLAERSYQCFVLAVSVVCFDTFISLYISLLVNLILFICCFALFATVCPLNPSIFSMKCNLQTFSLLIFLFLNIYMWSKRLGEGCREGNKNDSNSRFHGENRK